MSTILKPQADEWAVDVQAGPVAVRVGVPTAIRLATAPWVAPLLHGRTLPTRAGRLHLRWAADTQTLAVRCAPCTLRAPGLGGQALRLREATLTVQRSGERVRGEVGVGGVLGAWQGTLTHAGLTARIEVPSTPISEGYALFADAIPELARAQIDGLFAFDATLSLPSGRLSVAPRVEGFAVSGLGTEALATARSACHGAVRRSRLGPDSALARAVVAAEDQRFFEHTGVDLIELTASLQRNQRADGIERGASTLSQQLARLLVTGSDRTVARKLRELLYAVEMEQTLGKARILRLYLDHAPWGEGVCGADAAAERYFGVRAQALDPAQAVWLAAMLHNPGMEAQRWAASGQINLARAQWVASGLRPMPRRVRAALAEQLAQVTWSPPTVTPRRPPPQPAP